MPLSYTFIWLLVSGMFERSLAISDLDIWSMAKVWYTVELRYVTVNHDGASQHRLHRKNRSYGMTDGVVYLSWVCDRVKCVHPQWQYTLLSIVYERYVWKLGLVLKPDGFEHCPRANSNLGHAWHPYTSRKSIGSSWIKNRWANDKWPKRQENIV